MKITAKAMKYLHILLLTVALPILLSGQAHAGLNQWTSTGPSGGLQIYGIAASPGYYADLTLFAASYGSGMFKSTDGGQTWIALDMGLASPYVKSVCVSPSYPLDETVFAGTNNGIYKSTNGGYSWLPVNNGLTSLSIASVAMSPDYETDSTLFAASPGYSASDGIFKSIDGGANWTRIYWDATSDFKNILISPGYTTDRTVFVPSGNGPVWKTTDGGSSWTNASSGILSGGIRNAAISPDFPNDQTLFVTTLGGVFKSVNGGAYWYEKNTGLTTLNSPAITVSPSYATDHTLFVGTYQGGVFKSTDEGAHWTAFNTNLTELRIWSLAAAPRFEGDLNLYAGTYGDGVWTYSPEYFFVYGTAGAGGSIAPTFKAIDINSSATFSITPDPGYGVDLVTGCAGTLSGTTYTTGPVTANCTVTATFGSGTRTLSTSVTGFGTVHNAPGTDMACTSYCESGYDFGTAMTLTAEPAMGQVFTGWSGACSGTGTCLVTMNAAKSVTAEFNPITWTLITAVTGSGTIHTAPGTDLTCRANCAANYTEGTVLTLTAEPDAGFGFSGWGGACSGTETCTVTMISAQTVTATFTAAAPCSQPVFPGFEQKHSSINDLGEVVWSQPDPVTGFRQIYSSTRGQLTNDLNDHVNPAQNNRGDLVWEQNGQIMGLISGQTVSFTVPGIVDARHPSINDNQEVVWVQSYGSTFEVYSNRRGILITGIWTIADPAINNAGDVVWVQYDPETVFNQVYKLVFGTTTPVRITSDWIYHFAPSISNSGEIAWEQGTDLMSTTDRSIYSNTRGQLGTCPAGSQGEPSINSCGDVTFTSYGGSITTVYRQGSKAPCISDPTGNDTAVDALLISNNTGTMGSLNSLTGDIHDWYQFSAVAGDHVTVTVNWGPTTPPNEIMVELISPSLTTHYGQNPGSPRTIDLVSASSGTYYVHLMAWQNTSIGYNLSIKVGTAGEACSAQVLPGYPDQKHSVINDLGETIMAMRDGSGAYQIYSATGQQLTNDIIDHNTPSMNNRGDIVWEQWGQIVGKISGQTVQFTIQGVDARHPSINDNQEVVWAQRDISTGKTSIYSNKRGALTTFTTDPIYFFMADPSINNAGDVVWVQYDPETYVTQVYKLVFGTTTPVRVTSDPIYHIAPSISNTGEIVWEQAPDLVDPFNRQIYSSTRGQLGLCPSGSQGEPSVNACGDVTYTYLATAIYRQGNSSPCVADTEPNNSMQNAPVINGNGSATGTVNPAADDYDDWYQFTANAGDPITVTVNWGPTTPPNDLMVELIPPMGSSTFSPNWGSPKTIDLISTSTGTYYVHLTAPFPAARIGYNVSIKVGSAGGACSTPVSTPFPWVEQKHSVVNDLGEIITAQRDGSGYYQIFSGDGRLLTTDMVDHNTPSTNNRGDLVWQQNGQIAGMISGQMVQFTMPGNTVARHPSINDNQEVVWAQNDFNAGKINLYSNKRGALTTGFLDFTMADPSINNAGDVVWVQNDPETNFNQVYKLVYGTTTPVRVTSELVHHFAPSISNTGEIVWEQGPDLMSTIGRSIYSNTQGQLGLCPVGGNGEPSVNACGDVTFTSYGGPMPTIYREGNNSPCVADTEPNDSMQDALVIVGNGSATGSLNPAVNDYDDWYQFTANAGDPITVTVNWGPTTPPNDLIFELILPWGGSITGPNWGSPKTIDLISTSTGTYYVHLTAPFPAARIGYNVSIKVGSAGGACSTPVSTPFPWVEQKHSVVNDLGEIITAQRDGSGYYQIFSGDGRLLTTDMIDHNTPSTNNRGDLVWQQNGQIAGMISGQTVQFTMPGNTDARHPSINDNQEVVWAQNDMGIGKMNIYSNKRGVLTTEPLDFQTADPSINNAGDVVWVQYDPQTYFTQVYKLVSGTTTPVRVTSDPIYHFAPSISNTGEIVWEQAPDQWDTFNRSIYSNTRGQLGLCPAGSSGEPSVNACGDVTFTSYGGPMTTIYRQGNNSPCVADTEPNDSMQDALVIVGNGSATGSLNPAAYDYEDWYQFTANAGDPVTVTVNWGPTTPPNDLMVGLILPVGGNINSTDPGSPKAITTTAIASGTYYVHLTAPFPAARIGYNVSIKVGSAGGACSTPVLPWVEQKHSVVNDLGEIISAQRDGSGYYQIFSGDGRQLTTDMIDHNTPSTNNRGDLVWQQNGQIVGMIAGQTVQFTMPGNTDARHPSINDKQEVVWAQFDFGTSTMNLYSNKRGALTTGFLDFTMADPSINNAGDVVWVQNDPQTNFNQVYKLVFGTTTPVRVTSDPVHHFAPSISNSGEIVWEQGTDLMSTTSRSIYSNTRGQLGLCPAGSTGEPSVNSCGDVTFTVPFTSYAGPMTTIYRQGNSSPCVSDMEPNDMGNATLISNNTTTLGMLSALAGDSEDSFTFVANERDSIAISVNVAVPGDMFLQFMDSTGSLLTQASGPTNPIKINTMASYSGVYYIRIVAPANSGYALSLDIQRGPQYQLSISPATGMTGSGRVVSDPATIDVALLSGGTGTYAEFLDSSIVMLTAIPDSGSLFAGWGGACAGTDTTCIVTMDMAKDVSAGFAVITPVSSVTLASDKASPSYPGAVITFTAEAAGGNMPEYKFRIRDNAVGTWTTVQNYSTVTTWSWTPSQLGSFDIQVMARNVGSGVAYQAVRNLTFSIAANSVASVTLTSDKPTLTIPGTVNFTATALGGNGNYEYKFRIKDNATGIWTTPRGYSSSNTWSWSATVGSYDVQVQARIAGSGVTYQAFKNITFTIVSSLIASVDLAANKTSPALLGTVGTVTFTAQALGGNGNYEYKFRIRNKAVGTWTVPQNYSSTNTWVWTPSQTGNFDIQVWTRTAGTTVTYEKARIVSFTIN